MGASRACSLKNVDIIIYDILGVESDESEEEVAQVFEVNFSSGE